MSRICRSTSSNLLSNKVIKLFNSRISLFFCSISIFSCWFPKRSNSISSSHGQWSLGVSVVVGGHKSDKSGASSKTPAREVFRWLMQVLFPKFNQVKLFKLVTRSYPMRSIWFSRNVRYWMFGVKENKSPSMLVRFPPTARKYCILGNGCRSRALIDN